MNGITKESFSKMPVENKLDILFDGQEILLDKMDKCEYLLGKQKIKNTAYSTISGFIGGVSVVLTKALFWK